MGEWRMRVRDGGVETGGRDSSKTGLVMKKKGKQKSTTGISASLTPDYRDKEVSVPASPRTTGIKRYQCQPHPGLQG